MTLLLAVLFVAQSQTSLPPAQRQAVNEIIRSQQPIAPNVLDSFLLDYLTSSSSAMREAGLRVIAARSQAGTKVDSDSRRAEQAVLERFRERVLSLLNDRDLGTRRAAIWAAGNLDLAATTDNSLRPDTTDALLRRYYREPDAEVRSEIVKAFAITSGQDGRIAVLMEHAAKDAHPRSRFYAVRGIARLAPAQGFDAVMELVRDRDVGVRVGAAMALTRYPERARGRLAELQALAAAETDVSARRAFEMALKQVQRQR